MDHLDDQIWSDVLAYLRHHHADICRQWFDDLEPVSFNGGLMRIGASSPVHQGYLQKQCTDVFNEALQQVTQQLATVMFIDPEDAGHPQVTVTSAKDAPSDLEAICDDLVICPDYSFDNFVVGPENRLAHAAALAVARSPGAAYNPLFIHGGVGLGKTHLLQAVCQHMVEHRSDASILYISCERFVSLFIESVQNGQCNAFRDRFRHLDMLVIDDIHFLTSRDRTQEEFFHTFNTLYQARKQIILSSDAKPDEIPDLEDRLVSRFSWGLVAEVTAPSFETRQAIIRKKAQMRGIQLPDDVIEYVSLKGERNIRELEGAMTAVQGHAMADGNVPITVDLARKALGEVDAPQQQRALSVQQIADIVVLHYDVKLTDLQSKRRHRSITLPRQMCMYLARKHTRHSLVEIGGFFGGRDHTTVMHAVQTIEDRRRLYDHIQRDVETLESKIGNNRPD
jgi:chromosomal replication initiator protein